jgi:tetratricopeptide (TPR) repeat protein
MMSDAGEWNWIVAFSLGCIHLWNGNPSAAEQELQPGYDALKKIGEKSHFSSIAHCLSNAVYLQGRYDEADRLTRECEEACRANDGNSQIFWRSTRAKVLAHGGEFEAAVRLGRAAVALAEKSDFLPAHADALMDLAEVMQLAGRPEEARPAVEEAVRLYGEKGNVVSAARARALLGKLS